MGFGDVLQQHLQVALKGALTPRALGQIVGNTVKGLHQQMIDDGRAPAVYQRIVDGRVGAVETSIQLDIAGKRTGTIIYRGEAGGSLAAASAFALREAEVRSPVRSGGFARSWVILVDGEVWNEDPMRIPADALQCIVVSVAPYARRLEQEYGVRGGHFTSRSRRRIRGGHPAYLVTFSVVDAMRQFQGVRVSRRFITMPNISRGGFRAPYVRKTPPTGPIMYPAVVIERKEAVRN